MIFLFGLGNPGVEYSQTRHNAGFMFADALAQKLGLNFENMKKFEAHVARSNSITIVKPDTFMNDSGRSAESIMRYFNHAFEKKNGQELQEVFVAHDDLDIPWGGSKLVFDSGPKSHNGVNSIRKSLGTSKFWYVRIGVDARVKECCVEPHQYVLRKLSQEEYTQLQDLISSLVDRLYAKIIS